MKINFYQILISTLFLILFFMMPFSYMEINKKWLLFFIPVLVYLIFLLVKKKDFYSQNAVIGLSILFMIIFEFDEKINFHINFGKNSINLSTILLSVAMIIFMVRVLIQRSLNIKFNKYISFFIITCTFLVLLMVLFFPFMHHIYLMKIDSDLQLLNCILKYFLILTLLLDFISDEKRFKQITLGVVFSLASTVILNLIFI
jgi:hypothetical protein